MIPLALVRKYVNRHTQEKVSAMKYNSIKDFEDLFKLIGDVYPTITPSHTRIWEGSWVVRKADNEIEFICCAHTQDEFCFNNKYELYK